MFKNLQIKWKLATLVAALMLALGIVGLSGYAGISTTGAAVNEIGVVRLPSIRGLLIVNAAQTAVSAANLSAAIYENNYQAQNKFADVLRLRQKAWARVDKGWKIYEPLPQTAEEAVLWKQFVADWGAWKVSDDKLGALISGMSSNGDERKQKDLFVEFYAQYQRSLPLFIKAEAQLDKIIDLNDAVASASVKAGSDAVLHSQRVMLVSALLAALAGAICAALVARAITRPINEAVKVAQTVASGDLTSQIEVTTTEETGQLLQALKDMNISLIRIVGQVRSGTDAIATASSQIASGNQDLSSRTEEQASSLEETASSMEELTSTVRQNADNAQQGNRMASTASSVAVKGGDVVARVVQTMDSINESSTKIVDIIGVIDGIAFQTNILALNAAVEAARAGEQGRGFAVVASEVRNLAQRSATAAKEIKALIGDSVAKVGAGSKLVQEAGLTMNEVVTSVQGMTDIMADISLATQEQSTGIDQINIAVGQMDTVTQQNAALVEQAAAAAEAMQNQAAQLAEVVKVFRLDSVVPAQTALRIEPASRPVQAPPRAQSQLNVARLKPASVSKDDWEEF